MSGYKHVCCYPLDTLLWNEKTHVWKNKVLLQGPEIYMTASKEVAHAKMLKLSGKFISKVFDGSYHQIPKWVEEMESYLASKKLSALEYFFRFVYCPKCAEKYGHNYCIAFAQVNK